MLTGASLTAFIVMSTVSVPVVSRIRTTLILYIPGSFTVKYPSDSLNVIFFDAALKALE